MEEKDIVVDLLTVANAISITGKKLLKNVVEKYNISYKEYYLLRHLEKIPGETQYNILKYTTLTKSRTNQIVTKLEKMGYLEKKVEMAGLLLKKPLYLTKLGKRIVEEGRENIYKDTIKNISDEEKLKYKLHRSKIIEILVDMKFTLRSITPEYLKK